MKKNDLVPVVSSQHGATITLFVSSLVPVILSSSFSVTQGFTILFLFSGFMFVEILQGRVRRGRWKSGREKYWNLVYAVMLTAGGGYQLAFNPLFLKIAPFLAITGVLCAAFIYLRLERLVISQFIVFSLFAMAGLLMFPADRVPEPGRLVILWAAESLYFGLSTFTVKFRMGGIGGVSVFAYLLLSLSVLFAILPPGLFKVLFICLLTLKIAVPVIAGKWFRSLKLKKIGLFEFASSVVFLLMTGLLFDPFQYAAF